ncbi:MAG: hypothetical protein SF028_00240 [Candidatus Sumerlaeia bacterium]|nr:hypothetical protein [Candidatus Sumerlaeia bacterium]
MTGAGASAEYRALRRQVAALLVLFLALLLWGAWHLRPGPREERAIRAVFLEAQRRFEEDKPEEIEALLARDFAYRGMDRAAFPAYLARMRGVYRMPQATFECLDFQFAADRSEALVRVRVDTGGMIDLARRQGRRDTVHLLDVSLRREGGDWLVTTYELLDD